MNDNQHIASHSDVTDQASPKKPYTAPDILSVESLEVMASTCSGGAFGKTVPVSCGTLGS